MVVIPGAPLLLSSHQRGLLLRGCCYLMFGMEFVVLETFSQGSCFTLRFQQLLHTCTTQQISLYDSPRYHQWQTGVACLLVAGSTQQSQEVFYILDQTKSQVGPVSPVLMGSDSSTFLSLLSIAAILCLLPVIVLRQEGPFCLIISSGRFLLDIGILA